MRFFGCIVSKGSNGTDLGQDEHICKPRLIMKKAFDWYPIHIVSNQLFSSHAPSLMSLKVFQRLFK